MNLRCVAGLAAALVVVPQAALAFVQTMTCSQDGGPYACEPGEIPRPVRWSTRCVQYYVNEQGADDVSSIHTIDPRTLDAIQASFATWTDVEQSDLTVKFAGLTNEDRAEYRSDRDAGGNANVVMWRDTDWPYVSKTAFAITSVTFDPASGIIADADIELNGEHHRFTVGDENVVVDVQNTLTHEVGHFVGLDHTPIGDATMFGSAPEGETQKRTLHADDIEGLAHIYSPTGIDARCPNLPDYFEAPDDEADESGCCAVVADPRRTPSPLAVIVALLGAVALRRSRI